jgi:hypothetical protein
VRGEAALLHEAGVLADRLDLFAAEEVGEIERAQLLASISRVSVLYEPLSPTYNSAPR